MAPVPESTRKKAIAAAWAVSQIGSQAWNEYCERFAENAFGTQGRYPSALAGGNALPLQRELKNAQPGDLIYFSADDTNNGYGHVGIYVGNGEMVSATPNGVKRTGILSDKYYAPRFRGVAAAPQDWQGRVETPDLVKGAEQFMARVTMGTMQGDTTVAEATSAKLQALQKQRDQVAEQLAPLVQRRDLLTGKTQGPISYQDADEQGNPLPLTPDETREIQRLERSLATLNTQIAAETDAIAKANAPKPGEAPTTRQGPGGVEYQWDAGQGRWVPAPGIAQPAAADKPARTFQGTDGRQYVLSDDGRTATLISGQPEPEGRKTTYQTITDPSTGDIYTYDPSTGRTVAKLFGGKTPLPQPISTDPNRRMLTFRDPTTGEITQQPNPDFDQLRSDLAQKAQELDLKYKQGLLDDKERDRQYQEWKTTYIDQPLQQFNLQREQWQQQFQYDQAQAAEQRRADQANREREMAAMQAGNANVSRWNQMAPSARSTPFVQQYAQAVENLGTPNYTPVSAAAITAPAPIETNANAYQQGAARALAAISPTAAMQIGAPPPQFNLQALMGAIPPFQYRPPT